MENHRPRGALSLVFHRQTPVQSVQYHWLQAYPHAIAYTTVTALHPQVPSGAERLCFKSQQHEASTLASHVGVGTVVYVEIVYVDENWVHMSFVMWLIEICIDADST